VELLVALGVVLEDGRRLKLLAQDVPVPVHHIDDLLRAKGINVAERTPAERRESNAEDGANV
jgi:hypothetical protein